MKANIALSPTVSWSRSMLGLSALHFLQMFLFACLLSVYGEYLQAGFNSNASNAAWVQKISFSFMAVSFIPVVFLGSLALRLYRHIEASLTVFSLLSCFFILRLMGAAIWGFVYRLPVIEIFVCDIVATLITTLLFSISVHLLLFLWRLVKSRLHFL